MASQYGDYVIEGAFARFQGKLSNALAQCKHDLSALQTQSHADWDMLQAAVRHRTRVQSLLDAERKNCQNVELVITDL